MATINNLVTLLSADPTPMVAGFARGTALINAFAKTAATTLSTPPRNAQGQFAKFGTDAANAMVDGLQKTFDAQQANLKEAFFRGALSREAFEQQGALNAKAFNTSLLNSLTRIDAKKAVPPEAREALINALKDVGDRAGQAFDPFTVIGNKFRGFGRDLTQLGRELSLAITLPLTGAAVGALKASDTFEKALDSIRNSTGATGTQLAALDQSLHSLFATLPNSADDIAKALVVISQSSGATGSNLDALATQVLNLSRITGSDLATNVQTSQKAFQAWGTSVALQAQNLDLLFSVSQKTGATVSDLSTSLAHFAPPLQQLGLSFAQSAALIGQFQKTGIDADSVLTTLQTSLSKFAEHGIDGAHALQLLVDSIKNASSDAEAINLAARIFGPRQATQLAEAVRSGKLDIQSLTDAVLASQSSINKSAAQTDQFGTAMKLLRNAATEAASAIGDSLQRTFLALAPSLTRIIDGVGAVARVFGTLPAPVQAGVTIILALAAAAGPTIFLLGGLSRAVGALSLAIGVLRDVKAAESVVALGTGAAEAATAIGGAEGAVGLLAAGLAAIGPAVVIAGTITGLVLLFEHLTAASRDAAKQVDEFTRTAQGLSNIQVGIDQTHLRDQLVTVNQQIDALQAKIKGEGPLATISDAGLQRVADETKQLDGLKQRAGILADQLQVLADVQDKNASASLKASTELNAFNKKVTDLITNSGKGLKVDAVTGQITGPLKQMQKLVADLQSKANALVPIKGFDTKAAESAINHLQARILELQNAGTPGIPTIFDQLTPQVVELEKQVNALISTAQGLGDPFEQISNAANTSALLSKFADVDAQMRALGDRTDLTAQKIRQLDKELRDTAAVQLFGNTNRSSEFTVSVIGEITRLRVAPAANADLVDQFRTGLQNIEGLAEQAGAAASRLNNLIASGSSLASIQDARREVDTTNAHLFDGETQFRRALDQSNLSLSTRNKLLAEIPDLVARAGIAAADVQGPHIDPQDIQNIARDIQAQLAPLLGTNGIKVKIETFLDLESLDLLGKGLTRRLQQAQIDAFATGNTGVAAAVQRSALDDATRAAQAFAAANRGADTATIFQGLAQFASQANASVEALVANMQRLTTIGRAISIADTFREVTAQIFGANSAMETFIGTIGDGLRAVQALQQANKQIATDQAGGGGASFAAVLQKVSAIGGIVGSVIGVGQAVFSAIKGIFGKSALDIEHDKILAANNQALARLTESLDRQAGTPGRIDDITRAVQGALATQTPFSHLFNAGAPISQEDFTNFLHSVGLTFAKVKAQADALGITLLDSKGHLTGLNQFMDALALDAKILTTIGSDLDTQQKLISVNNALNNVNESPAQQVQDSIDAIAKVLDQSGGHLGAALEQALAQGPDQLRAALKAIVSALQRGEIPLQELGGLSATDLLNAIGGTADALNSLAGTASDVTEALLNVPSGFKRALAEFNAQLPQTGPTVPVAPTAPAPLPTDTAPTQKPPDTTTGPLLDLLKQLVAPLQNVSATAISTSGVESAGKAVSDVADALAGLATAGGASGTAISDVLTELGLQLPAASNAAAAALSVLIQRLASATVTAPAPTVTVAPLASITLAAPTFHVEHPRDVTIAAPAISVAPAVPVTLPAPTVTFSTVKLSAPVVDVRPFAPISLAAPQVLVAAPMPVSVPAPQVVVPPSEPVQVQAPRFSVRESTQTLTLTPPAVRVAGHLSAVVVQPPPAVVKPYSGSVSLSPPLVQVAPLATVHMQPPLVAIPKAKAITLSAPSVHVTPLRAVELAQPKVSIKPIADLELAAPKVTVAPLRVDQPLQAATSLNSPLVKLPDLRMPSELKLSDDSTLTKALAQLIAQRQSDAQQQQAATQDQAIHIHGDINVDARDKTSTELFQMIRTEARKVAQQKTGNSTNILAALE